MVAAVPCVAARAGRILWWQGRPDRWEAPEVSSGEGPVAAGDAGFRWGRRPSSSCPSPRHHQGGRDPRPAAAGKQDRNGVETAYDHNTQDQLTHEETNGERTSIEADMSGGNEPSIERGREATP